MAQLPGIIPAIERHEAEFIAIRRAIHSHPELGFEEEATSRLVAESLGGWGYRVATGIGGTGVVGQLRCGNGARRLGIRADMDALPIQEETGLSYASRLPGKMHACGHDGHTAILLAAARHLAETRRFDGTLNLIFQPAEEGQGGAVGMMADGLFERFPCDAVFALHNGPTLPAGSFVVQPGVLAASVDTVSVTLTGKGGHGGMPHTCVDPVVAMASIIMALQTIVSRNLSPDQPAVVTVGAAHAGEVCNVIPDSARLELTVRAYSPAVQRQIEGRLRELVSLQAQSYGVTAEIDWQAVSRVLVNTPEETRIAREVAEAMVGPQGMVSLPAGAMGGDDFSWMLEKVPGCYLVLGNGVGSQGGCMIHNPGYDFNDEILSVGASYWTRLAETYLK
ncbi:amidohydrolase [Chromobacterium sp. ATCC 53434]|uniref:M20 aminoacylase family protein n=1 Tax=Chromobacterium sp. (strain ATCC 53434 / SC 14030) TaxID=2059672 RepID=UPI000C76BE1F|nr:M20 aminoacylase family protein [Chromobacterium sp. ATCC 53434]AUH51501.1 amidohydrolase [Chromobacterium sp. ATCC 53434]